MLRRPRVTANPENDGTILPTNFTPRRRRFHGSRAARRCVNVNAMDTTTTLAPRPMPRDVTQPLPTDVAYLTTVLVNACVIGRPHGGGPGPLPEWVLVDAGIPFNASRIARFARARFGDAPPRAILLTHGHFDHVGSLAALLRRWPDTPVYAHRLELPYLTGHSSYPPPDTTVGGGVMARTSFLFPRHAYNFRPNVMPLPADGVVPFLADWQWVPTPGHSPGHVSFFREADRTLIAGDAFVTQRQESLTGVMTMGHVVHGPPTYFTTDWVNAKASVQALAALKPMRAITGHGLPVANPRLAHDLHLLSEQFERYAMPPDGRYVRHPAWADDSGTVWVPPAIPNPKAKIVAGLALAAATVALAKAYAGRHHNKELTRMKDAANDARRGLAHARGHCPDA
jgi:glyoxylase-like metal-dependent hydrolase (beta-lactamase superfamily II)